MNDTLKDYINKKRYDDFIDLFKSKDCLSLIKNSHQIDEEDVDSYLNAIIPTKSDFQYCELELDNPPRQNTPQNIDFYKCEISTKGYFVVDSSAQDFYTYIDDDYLKLDELDYLNYQLEIEPLKVSKTNFQVLVMKTNPDDIPSLPNDLLFLRVNVDYKKPTNIWESYLLLAYQQYLSGNYHLARLLSFISFEALIRYCRDHLKLAFNDIRIKNIRLSDLAELESITQELNNEHIRLTEKFKQLLNIFSSLAIETTFSKKKMTSAFNNLEKSRNKIAHGQNNPTESDNKVAFIDTLVLMTKFIAMIQAG